MKTTSIWQKFVNLFKRRKQPQLSDIKVKSGVWYARDQNGDYLLGIDRSVYDQIGKITFADFPTQLTNIEIDDDLLDIEGDKSVETLKSPVSGRVIERNHEIGDDIDRLNQPNPQVNWIMKIEPAK
ncbi:glycine cleavage system protein H [Lentilactobacillus fungorum]|jgi:glycine cleavage system H lipoate-binding protein|uniref:Glycine cleavage system protein H n=1 Tax=Lentilactobacillus fungorum TaxID=2201250 RepID=A0ABQ3VZ63_9LACO|nr:glycine cleavage system protein H [Lentilactobacillus fungorum]GHP13572.1 glycine cleavage system protein H [Lentilactobacillus fungorum]